jgi:hypothetical protein
VPLVDSEGTYSSSTAIQPSGVKRVKVYAWHTTFTWHVLMYITGHIREAYVQCGRSLW